MARMNQAMNDLLRYNAALLAKKRSTFNRSHSKATTFDSGYLIPILIDDILPGDEVELSVDALVRMTTPLHPVMDNCYLDLFAFFCPDRIVWDNAKAFYGENLDAEYNDLGEYQRPSFVYGNSYSQVPERANTYCEPQSLLDYMEFPPLVGEDPVSRPLNLLEFRMYQKIYNDFFRASEIQPSVRINTGDSLTTDERESVFQLRKVGKLHDYFTSLLPRPQAGIGVSLPLADFAPIVTNSGGSLTFDELRGDDWQYNGASLLATTGGSLVTGGTEPFTGDVYLKPHNLVADLTDATSATINSLRTAITVQQALEIDAAGGLRYSSIIRSHWGVVSPDDVLQRPQYLGSHREIVGMHQVAQTSSSTDTQELGQLGAYSATRIGDKKIVSHSFTEYGTLMVLCCVRPLHTYSQGYPVRAKKLSRFDIYLPVFDNIGNQPVFTDEICACSSDGNITPSDTVLGYKEAWSEYRMKENKVTGLMRPDVDSSLGDIWTYADDFTFAPILNSDFITEDSNLIGRTLAVTNEPQFFGDFYFNYIHTRSMGVHSIPGLTRF